jgi:hypothetical protein
MAQWKYTIQNGRQLRQAIYQSDAQATAKWLFKCFQELHNKMSDEDKEDYGYRIEDIMDTLRFYVVDPDDDDNIDYYLEEFYHICDDVKAWVAV